MTEGAVRNAISVGDLRTIKRGTSTWVQHADALAWLRGRKGFVPTPDGPDGTSDTATALRGAGNAKEFGGILKSALATRQVADDELARAAGLPMRDCRRWLDGDVARDFRTAAAIARLLEISEADLIDSLRRVAREPPD